MIEQILSSFSLEQAILIQNELTQGVKIWKEW